MVIQRKWYFVNTGQEFALGWILGRLDFGLDFGLPLSYFFMFFSRLSLVLTPPRARRKKCHYSQGATGNFIYLLEGQIQFALKLSVGCLL